ncbi:F0F1 ATP synthase subunit B [bacterium]|nr:F0F1 ATP synthase subunit B [bacterium]
MELWAQFGELVTNAVTFIVFFWIMKRFAWGPLLNLLERRQQAVEEGFADIDRRKADTEKLHQDYAAHLRNIEQEGRAKIQEAVAEGRRVADEIVEKARAESQAMAERARRNIEIELAKARVELRDDMVSMTMMASEKLLRQRVDTDTDRRLVSEFLADLDKEMQAR